MILSRDIKLALLLSFYKIRNITLRYLSVNNNLRKVVLLITKKDNLSKIVEINRRSLFYLSGIDFETRLVEIKNPIKKLSKESFACIGTKNLNRIKEVNSNGYDISNLDFTDNPSEGYEWHKLAYENWKLKNKNNKRNKKRFVKVTDKLLEKNLNKAYVFGTGPSLAKVNLMKWNDGYTIVCNTIVRDKKTWNHLKPDIIVAADTIYHFGHTKFAKKFRSDLKKRLSETKTIFIYPELFQWLVEKEFQVCIKKCFPMPIGVHKDLSVNFKKRFALPGLGNILPLMLLPIASYLSKNVYLWGFDGRNPKDKLFWSNSKSHTYDELMSELVKAHPAFYKYNVPKQNPNKYVEMVQGEELDKLMRISEKKGWKYRMMHHSWTKTLNKRFSKN